MNKKCRSRKKMVGKTKLTSEPKRIAKPNPKTIPPRSIGFRLYWKKPSVTKVLEFLLESNVVLFVKVLVA